MTALIDKSIDEMKGEWPKNTGIHPILDYPGVFYSGSNEESIFMSKGVVSGHEKVCTRDEFNTRVQERRKTPSFKDHPDAKCFVQNGNGEWYKNTKTDEVTQAAKETGFWVANYHCGWVDLHKGEVIGDWRDTLIKRPEPQEATPKFKKGDRVLVHGYVCQFVAYWDNGCILIKISGFPIFIDDMNEVNIMSERDHLIFELRSVVPEISLSMADAVIDAGWRSTKNEQK